jgi:uncharacterized protein YciI
VVFESGPGLNKAQRLFPDHIAFVTAHLKTGELLSMGPSDTGGGLAVFQAAGWETARRILADEPFTKNGVLKIAQHFTWTGCTMGAAAASAQGATTRP